jgi:hypothetical protein
MHLQKLKEIPDLRPRLARRLIDIRLQYFIRKADSEAAKDDMPSCLASIREFQQLYQTLDENQVDRKAKGKIMKIFPVLEELREFYSGTSLSNDITKIREWFYSQFGEYLSINRAPDSKRRESTL